MKRKIENTYGYTLKFLLYAVNPIKKKVKKTECIVHQFINEEALEILRNDGYEKQYKFFKKYIKILNKGVIWADADFKSANHFYHHEDGRGLYGCSNALIECESYYNKALKNIQCNNIPKAIFYLGAACHLIQDTTVPAHANVNLRNHKSFETWAIRLIQNGYTHPIKQGAINYNAVEEYIKENTKYSNRIDSTYRNIINKNQRYAKILDKVLLKANQSTAGFLLMFYNDINN
ncbi:phospholipase [Clostridium argentinense]|nr:phospholipase [Clostridium argentinense]NFF39575.1 phospholipase [Clostridium argentinense]NFP51320.1 phospholipase [Clostridium argentinense]NFP72762.1 phospholipase [Clostridium argentinense]NFP77323.1 phospholipase [Clostridium argentinense]